MQGNDLYEKRRTTGRERGRLFGIWGGGDAPDTDYFTLGPMEMNSAATTWQFASGFDKKRREALNSVGRFSEIVDRILAEASVVRFQVCRGKVGLLKGCNRPEFEIAIAAGTVDLFFNSTAGYRAQYLANPDEGQKQNAKLIATLTGQLTAYAESHPTKVPMSTDRVRLALSACSAKVWLPETSFSFNHDLIEEITVPLWKRNALAALEAFAHGTRPDPEQQEKAIWGLRAAQATSIEVKGGFVSASGEEVVPFDKISRRLDIHNFGYA